MTRFAPRASVRAARRGFSLIEVLAALLIFSVAIMAILEGQSQSLAIQSSLMDRFRAQTLAENRLEEILLEGDFFEGEEEGEYEGEDARFTWATSILETTTVGLVEIVVSVRWRERGSEREVRMATLAMQPS